MCVTCDFIWDLNPKISWKWNNTYFVVCMQSAHFSYVVIWRTGSGSHAWIIYFQGWLRQYQEIELCGRLFGWKQRHFWKMAAKQECTQWNGRSDATTREPRSSPCTSLKVYKPYNYVPILLCVETDRWLQAHVTIFGKNDPVLINICIKTRHVKVCYPTFRFISPNESSSSKFLVKGCSACF